MASNPIQILIVEHETLIAKEIEDRLIKLGYGVCGQAGSGEEAIKHVAEERPDLVLIDIRLAGDMCGIDVANRLKERDDIPVVLLSAKSDEELDRHLVASGPYSCLTKPFEASELHATIQTALEKHSLHRTMRKANEKLWDRSIVGIVRAEPNGRYLAANPAAVRLYGFESERNMLDAVQDPTNDIYVRPEERRRLVDMIREKGKAIGVETEIYQHGSRKTIWISQNVWPAHGDDGQLLFLEGYMEDITQRKKAELALEALNATLEYKVEERTAALADSERKYRAILDNMQDTYYRTDAEGRIVMASPSASQLLGYSPEELAGQKLSDFYINSGERDTFLAELQSSGGELSGYEARLERRDGTIVWVSTSARLLHDETGVVVGVEGITRDITDHKNAAHALEMQEGQLRLVIDNLPVLITYVDTDERFLLVNQTCADWYNRKQDEIVGQYVADIHGDRYSLFKPRIDAVLSGESVIFEDRLLYPDGVWRDIRLLHVPHFDSAGVVQGYFSLAEDITEHKQAEDALRENEQRFRDLAMANSDWFWEMDAERRHTIMSQAVSANVGNDPDWYVGRSHDEIVAAYYDPADWRPFDEAFAARRPYRDLVVPRTDQNGKRTWIRSSGVPIFDQAGEFKGFRGCTADVTDAILAEQALTASEASLSGILAIAPNAIITVGEGGEVRMFNRAAQKIFGYEENDIIGKSIDVLIPPKFRADHPKSMARFKASQEQSRQMSDRGDVVGLRKDGSEFPAEASISKVQLGDELLITVILQDITQRKNKDEQLRRAQKMEAVGQLTGGVAHDFNNLLAAIIGNLDLIEDGGNFVEESDRVSIATALRAALRGAELTDRLMAFSRQQPLDAKTIRINEMLPQFRRLAEPAIGEDIAIKIKPAVDLWPTMVDAGQLENALLNLAVNARDAMPKGGELTIETANRFLEDDDAERYEDLVPGAYVMIAVSDNGTGMPAEVQEHVFEPFFTTKDVGEGSGLGLSMVFGFTKQSGGQVSIVSEEGEGTTVSIYLPRAAPTTNVEIATEEGAQDRPTGNETILVVEDDNDVRDYLIAVLGRLGYTVYQAEDGPSALEVMAVSVPIDLLLTDMILPRGMSGHDVAGAFRERYPEAGVLYSSGYTRDVLDRRGQLNEGVAMMKKPYQTSALALRVREVLDSRK